MKETFLKYFKGDTTIWIIVVLLSLVSMLTVYSATGTLAYKKMGGNTMFYLIRHGSFLLFGLGIIFTVHRINYKVFAKLSNLFLYASVGLLVFTLLSGVSLNSASRWVSIMGVQFQTSDLAKLALILYIAKELGRHQNDIDNLSVSFWPIMKWVGIICLLILPANFSTSAMLFMICCVLMFIGRIDWKHIAKLIGFILGIIIVGFLLAYSIPQIRSIGRVETWMGRVESFAGTGEHSDAAIQKLYRT